MKKLAKLRRLQKDGNNLRYVLFHEDYPVMRLTAHWPDTAPATQMKYVGMLMSTDPGDLILDPTCGSGTTAYVAEKWGRRWITCNSSRVSVALARQRLLTSIFEYYELAHGEEGVSSGFRYKTVPHITLGSLANDEPRQDEVLYDEPHRDTGKVRVSGPFTVEAVPAPAVIPVDEIEDAAPPPADKSVARSGETQRQSDWRNELLKTGIRGKGGQRIEFSRVEPLAGTQWLHADAETKPADKGVVVADEIFAAQRVVLSFGPDHAPLEQRQVELALNEAETLRPRPKIIVFAAFQFDPEAAKDIDETKWPGVTLLKAQMNADLLTADLKKKRASNESFWLIGQPDVQLEKIAKGADKGKFRVTVKGFDYYNTRTGEIESGTADKIALWMLDPDYDGRSLFPRQVFFIADIMKEGLERLARTLKAEIDEELIQAYVGSVSLPFEAGQHKRTAVKIIDDRGIESLKIIGLA